MKKSFSETILKRRRRSRARFSATLGMSDTDIPPEALPFFVPTDELERDLLQKGKDYVSFAHYDYLGLAHHPAVIEAGVAALRHHGSGAGASRLVGGERAMHGTLERDLARFLGVEATLTMISGYLTNLSVISHLLDGNDLLIVDELAHNSIMQASRCGTFTTRAFAHNDLAALDRLLTTERDRYRNVLIVVEGLYSMDGDFPDLPALIEIKNRNDAWLMLDEAHSYGVLGRNGRGLTEHFGTDPQQVDLTVGTLSKTFAASGGFIAGSATLIDWLRFSLPGFIYSVGLSPVTVATAHAALRVLQDSPDRVALLHDRSRLFLDLARRHGLDTTTARGFGVVPILFGSNAETLAVSAQLREQGIFAPPVIHVAVPQDKPRVRFFISASHSPAQITRVVETVAKLH